MGVISFAVLFVFFIFLMKVSNIQVNKSENELTPKLGKMEDFRIRNDGGLREKISEDRGY